MPNRLLLLASESRKLEELSSTNRFTRPIVDRYVAGESLESALTATERLNRAGIDVSLDLLGESVTDLADSQAATDEYLQGIRALGERSPSSTVSVKLTQLGIYLSAEECESNLRKLLEAARENGVEVEVDMEHSSAGRDIFRIFRSIHAEYPETRLAIQANMRSTVQDLVNFEGAPLKIRLVKGAFDETLELALRSGREVDAQYAYLTDWALENLPDPAFGTHDDVCINYVKEKAAELGLGKRDFEFQMLYGVRANLQEELVRAGYRVRVYLPYGTHWYPYLTRRMAERPANLFLFLRSLVSK